MKGTRRDVFALATVISAIFLWTPATWAQTGKHAINFDMTVPAVPEGPPFTPQPGVDSWVQLRIYIKINDDRLPDGEEVELGPQKGGILQSTTWFRPSNEGPWGGTMRGIVDFDNDILQIAGADLVAEITGEYCPGPEEGNPDHECPELTDPQDKGEFPAPLGYSLTNEDVGTPDAGSLQAAIREGLVNVNGQSPIGPNASVNPQLAADEIDTWHWHLFTVDSQTALDGTGVAADVSHDVSRLQAPDNPGHNENHDPQGAPGEADFTDTQPRGFYIGKFESTGNADEYHVQIPLNAIGLLANDLNERNPEEWIRLEYNGELNGVGTLLNELIDGDANNDGIVDGLDVNIVSLHWEEGEDHTHNETLREDHLETHPKYQNFFTGDFNMDSMVGQPDLDILVANFGMMAGAGAGGSAVPEPTTAVLGLLASLALLLPRRRGK